ncbi:gliding motility-associated peptidyl-prolyl isomerase GldI [Flavobacterium sp. '19STA2R22 D10 B1']|uniref:gliding motility-associated peptidyl-prolyl isomerase GldI n=1 Tax=Flavobacterium aerium TaxID=3037261 RepID=UPI00278BC1E1|nr:gliding motility-associated peptidyl-prolyl isomerase GldI [Flavobacterium sp. '19STA2R22 D10 B1']
MKNIGLLLLFVIGAFSFASCSQQQQARKPISQTSGSFLKESIERNKELIANEESLIDSIIKSNPKIEYLASSKGYWYHYEVKADSLEVKTPVRGDVAYFDYEVKDLLGNLIYSDVELRPQTYYVDKENIMMGLRDGIKLMKEGEKVTFLFPSHMAYGYHGDNKKIGTNEPIICTVTLNDIKAESEVKQ